MKLGPFSISFKSKPEPTLPTDDVVWSEESAFWKGADGTKYNPDSLIGKKGWGIYRKMMNDEQVKAVVRFKRDAITSREYFFEVDKDELGEDESARRVKICEEIISQMRGSFNDAINGMLSSQYQGFSITEKTHTPIEVDGLTYWGLKHLRLKPYKS